jgi:hypothetical protein
MLKTLFVLYSIQLKGQYAKKSLVRAKLMPLGKVNEIK